MESPNHFELLGVDPTLTNDLDVEEAVNAGVKRCVKLLSRVPPNQHRELQVEVRHRLKIARDTLLDPFARKAYLESLKNTQNAPGKFGTKPSPRQKSSPQSDLVAPQRRSPKTTGEPAKQATAPNKPRQNDLLPPGASPRQTVVESPKRRGAKAPPSKPSQANVPPPIANKSIPVASAIADSDELASIPVAQTLEAEPQEDAPPTPIPASPVPAQSVSPPVSIKNRIRRRRSSLAETLSKVAMIAMLLGGCYLIYANFESLRKLADGALQPTIDENPSDTPPPNPSPSRTNPSDKDVDESIPGNQGNRQPPAPMPSPDSETDTDPESPPSDPDANSPELNPNNPNEVAQTTPPNRPEEATSANSNSNSTDETRPVELPPAQLRHLDRQFHGAWRSLFTRDSKTFATRLLACKTILGDGNPSQPLSLVRRQQSVAKSVKSLEDIAKYYQKFWDRVNKSSNAIVGNRVIEVGEQMLGFVEADDRGVLLRNEGINIRYDFVFLPSGLAVALVESGDIDNTALWNLELATVYAIHRETPFSYSAKINECLSSAEAGGYDVQFVHDFLDAQFEFLGPVDDKKEYQQVIKGTSPSIESFRKSSDYVSVDRLPQSRLNPIANDLWNLATESTEDEILVMHELLEVSIQAGDVLRADDAINQLSRVATCDEAALRCRVYRELGKNIGTDFQSRMLVESGIRVLLSIKSSSKKIKDADRLFLELQQVAKRFRWMDVVRRLDQLNRPNP